ncbi:MAG: hypothetical protein IPL26_20485 [Leptospiraceae bacterium]|nr:hypothetical protein [Leptospiraceae bacterium]
MTILVASDYYRWVSISACMGLVSILYLISTDLLTIFHKQLKLLALFSLLLPFGGAQFDWPFPMQ